MSFTTVGGSSILTIFAVLCFVVFALLSLSTAKANSNLTSKSIDAVTNYYKADTEAEEILAKVTKFDIKPGARMDGFSLVQPFTLLAPGKNRPYGHLV